MSEPFDRALEELVQPYDEPRRWDDVLRRASVSRSRRRRVVVIAVAAPPGCAGAGSGRRLPSRRSSTSSAPTRLRSPVGALLARQAARGDRQPGRVGQGSGAGGSQAGQPRHVSVQAERGNRPRLRADDLPLGRGSFARALGGRAAALRRRRLFGGGGGLCLLPGLLLALAIARPAHLGSVPASHPTEP